MDQSKRRRPNKHLVGVLLFIVCFCGSFFLIPPAHYYRGKLEAHWDIAYGNYKGKRCVNACIAVNMTQEYERRLLEYANIRIEITEECGYRMQGYNEVQWSRIEHLYPGAYERAIQEAYEWERRRSRALNE